MLLDLSSSINKEKDKTISSRGNRPNSDFNFLHTKYNTLFFLPTPMASPTLITPTTAAAARKPLPPIRSRITPTTSTTSAVSFLSHRRDFLSLSAITLFISPVSPAFADSDEEYVKETAEVINKVRNTITLDKNDPNIAAAVAELRETSNSWVAKYRREKALLGRASFRDMYSALNAVSGHYISFGPTAPLPAKRKQRILEEVETAEKALSRGR